MFSVEKCLRTDVKLEFNIWDARIETIFLLHWIVELAHGSALPIIKNLYNRLSTLAPIPSDQHFIVPKSRPSQKHCVFRRVTFNSKSHTCVPVSTPQTSLMKNEQYWKLYKMPLCVASHGNSNFKSRQEINMMIANIGNKPIILIRGQQVGIESPQPSTVAESNFTNTQICRIKTDEQRTYKKRILNARGTALINPYLANLWNCHMIEEDKPITAGEIDLSNVKRKNNSPLCNIFRRHTVIKNCRLGSIKVSEHAIDFEENNKLFNSAAHRCGQMPRQLDPFQLKQQLDAGVIEPAVSKWAVPSFSFPKKLSVTLFPWL